MKKILLGLLLLVAACSSSTLPSRKVYVPAGSFPDNGTGIVSIHFTSSFWGDDRAVASYWRKVDEKGNLGEEIKLTYNGTEHDLKESTFPVRKELMLEPGTYTLSGVSNGASVGYEFKNPWKNGKPTVMSMTVVKGKKIKMPLLKFVTVTQEEQGGTGDDYSLLVIQDIAGTYDGKWTFGNELNIKDGKIYIKERH